jgi:hypothetical protein
MTRKNAAERTPTFVATPIPAPILQHHRNVTLCVDFFYVQGIVFLHTISRNIGFRTVSQVPNRAKSTILCELKTVLNIYSARGFTVHDVHADAKFECVRHDLYPIVLNIAPADSHVGEVERSIRTIKERLRSCVHGLPFKRLPKLLVSHMTTHAVRCLNQFPWANGISDTLSPSDIMLGTPLPDYTQMRLEFGSYAQVFEDNSPSNTPRARSLGAIALTPTGNAQGDVYFLSLATGHQISRHNWTAVPMTDIAVDRVELLAYNEGQPLIQEHGLVVEWRPDQPLDPDEYDPDFAPPPDLVDDDADFALFDPIPPDELLDIQQNLPLLIDPYAPIAALDQGAYAAADENENENAAADENENENEEADPEPEPVHAPNEEEPNEEEADDVADVFDEVALNEEVNEEADDVADALDEGALDEAEGAIAEPDANPPYNLRQRNTRISFKDAIDNPHGNQTYYPPATTNVSIEKQIFGLIMTQMTAKAAIKKHGKAAEDAMMDEYIQLENLNVYQPINPSTLTRDQQKSALRAINLIKEKRDGKLKGRTVADGRPQRNLYDKSETASPTVSSEALMLSIVIDAHEQRDVATADVAGAYL